MQRVGGRWLGWSTTALLVTLYISALGGSSADAAPRKHPVVKIDRIALASILIRDGHYDRAASVLAKVQLANPTLDRAQYHVLMGVVASKRKNHRGVIRHLEQAIRRGKNKRMIHLLVAQAHFRLKDYRATLRALKRAGPAASKDPMALLFKAHSYWRLGRKAMAWQALDRGTRRFPKHREMARQRILLLIELGLYQQAAHQGRRFLARKDATLDDHLTVAEAFRRAQQPRPAILILEGALLIRPLDRKILLRLARCYVVDKKPLAAASLVHRASYLTPALRVEAAELYRRAGKTTLALLLNAQVLDQRAKLKQRLGLLIEARRFEQAASLEPRLSRLGLLKDQEMIYALAYCYFRVGRFRNAERWLKQVTKASLYRKAISLRRSMAACEGQGWMCQQ